MGGVIDSVKMTAFSHPAVGMDANDVGGDEGEWPCAARTASAPSHLSPKRSHPGVVEVVDGVRVDNLSFGGGFATSPETLLTIPAGLGEEEPVQDMGDHDVASADWLDTTLAMLDDVGDGRRQDCK